MTDFTEGLKEGFPVLTFVDKMDGIDELGTCVGIVDGTVVEGVKVERIVGFLEDFGATVVGFVPGKEDGFLVGAPERTLVDGIIDDTLVGVLDLKGF